MKPKYILYGFQFVRRPRRDRGRRGGLLPIGRTRRPTEQRWYTNLMETVLLLLIATIAVPWSGGCTYGPKAERKSTLSYLNGEQYITPTEGPTQLVVPIVKRRERNTQIKGRVVVKDGAIETPIRYAKVTLLELSGKTVVETMSDLGGEFLLKGAIKNGTYQLVGTLGQKKCLQIIVVDRYELNNVICQLKEITS